MGGVGSGPRKKPSTIIKECLEDAHADIPAMMAEIKRKGLAGDKECLFYYCNRIMGNPHQSVDQRMLVGKLELTAEQYREALDKAKEYEVELLDTPQDKHTAP